MEHSILDDYLLQTLHGETSVDRSLLFPACFALMSERRSIKYTKEDSYQSPSELKQLSYPVAVSNLKNQPNKELHMDHHLY